MKLVSKKCCFDIEGLRNGSVDDKEEFGIVLEELILLKVLNYDI